MTIGAQILTITIVAILSVMNTRFNRKLDKGLVPAIQGIEGFRFSI